jgi:hypothetical protein
LRAIFANKDPLLAYHLLKTEIPIDTVEEFIEYLDAKETLEEWGRASAKAEQDRKQQQSDRLKGRT